MSGIISQMEEKEKWGEGRAMDWGNKDKWAIVREMFLWLLRILDRLWL